MKFCMVLVTFLLVLLSKEIFKVISNICIFKFSQLEGLSILFSHISKISQSADIVDQVKELLIFFVIVKGNDRDTIFQLEPKWVDGIINYD